MVLAGNGKPSPVLRMTAERALKMGSYSRKEVCHDQGQGDRDCPGELGWLVRVVGVERRSLPASTSEVTRGEVFGMQKVADVVIRHDSKDGSCA